MNRTPGAPTPDDERDDLYDDPTSRRPYLEPKYPFHDPGSDPTQPRSGRNDGLRFAAWPVAGLALILGVAVLVFQTTGSAFAVIVGAAVIGLVVLLADRYID